MTMSMKEAVTALKRFGLGPRPGEPARILSDPRGFVLWQLEPGPAALIANLPSSVEAWQQAYRFIVARREQRMAEAEAEARGDDIDDTATLPAHPVTLSRAEMTARVEHAVTTDKPLVERLVGFWSNHFTVAMQGPYVRGMVGAYEREAIRPNVLGRFRTMLHAVAHHPAMLAYLDNNRSIGPNSRAGQHTGKGLNENLAREILELHTVGVNAGYTQHDVTDFARALTGWTVHGRDDDQQGRFRFIAARHEPGPVTVMGRTYPEGGIEQAEAILDDLAVHPATARHIARKLAIHFVGEKAPISLVERLAAEFRQSDGDLAAVMQALVASDDAWTAPPAKVLPPYDFLVAVYRALEDVPRQNVIVQALRTFGQPLWNPNSPAGWPDEDEAWASPHGMVERLDWVSRITARSPRWIGADIAGYADSLFGDTLSDYTHQAIMRAASRHQALALLFMSPEFQRR